MSYCLIAMLTAAPGEEERVDEGLALNETASRQEPGVLDWIVYRSSEDPRRFLLYEVYTDAAALDAHRATEHFARYEREVVPLLERREPSYWEPLTG